MPITKGNPYHRKGGKGGGRFVSQADQGVSNVGDNKGKRPKSNVGVKHNFIPSDNPVNRGSPNSLLREKGIQKHFKGPKALPQEREMIVGEGVDKTGLNDNPTISFKSGSTTAKPALAKFDKVKPLAKPSGAPNAGGFEAKTLGKLNVEKPGLFTALNRPTTQNKAAGLTDEQVRAHFAGSGLDDQNWPPERLANARKQLGNKLSAEQMTKQTNKYGAHFLGLNKQIQPITSKGDYEFDVHYGPGDTKHFRSMADLQRRHGLKNSDIITHEPRDAMKMTVGEAEARASIRNDPTVVAARKAAGLDYSAGKAARQQTIDARNQAASDIKTVGLTTKNGGMTLNVAVDRKDAGDKIMALRTRGWSANSGLGKNSNDITLKKSGLTLTLTMTDKPSVKVGDTVEFAHPGPDEVGKDGKQIPMKVLEDRGDRILVEDQISGFNIKPTHVVSKADLKPMEKKKKQGQISKSMWKKIGNLEDI
jgi:hypothetical protein